MRDVFESDFRITDPAGCVGLTVAAVRHDDPYLVVEFTDGRFLVVSAVPAWEDAEIRFDTPVEMGDAAVLGLIGYDTLAAFRAAQEAEQKADRERHEREQYERLRAKYGDEPAAGR